MAVSNDPQDVAQLTQSDFPHLTIISDDQQVVAKALDMLHPGMGPDGTDTNAPTKVLVDGGGIVRWVYRDENFVERLPAERLLQAADANLGGG